VECSCCSQVCFTNGGGCSEFTQKEEKKTRVPNKWHPPSAGLFKLNTDGAFNGKSMHGATEAVVRDSNGSLLGAQARWYNRMDDALMAKALAVRDVIELARDMGVTRLQVKSDSSSVVQMLNNLSGYQLSIAYCHYLS
jgi:hypothetical protein